MRVKGTVMAQNDEAKTTVGVADDVGDALKLVAEMAKGAAGTSQRMKRATLGAVRSVLADVESWEQVTVE